VEDNTLQAQISGLRKALGAEGQNCIVTTVPGRGYRLVLRRRAVPRLRRSHRGAGGPSIAVLAFDNLSGDAADESFADGMAEDLITELVALSPPPPRLLVVARNSSLHLQGAAVSISARSARNWACAIVLEGQHTGRAGNRIRVTAQLIESRGAGSTSGRSATIDR